MDIEMLWTLPIAGAAIGAGYLYQRFTREHGYLEEDEPSAQEPSDDPAGYEYRQVAPAPRQPAEGDRRSVFVSYRRQGSSTSAHVVREALTKRGFDVFIDVASFRSGQFAPEILAQIEARRHFLLVIDPHSLDRIREPEDWLHRELAHALRFRRHIVPLLFNGATMPDPRTLPADIAALSGLNAVVVPNEYIPVAMELLGDVLRADHTS